MKMPKNKKLFCAIYDDGTCVILFTKFDDLCSKFHRAIWYDTETKIRRIGEEKSGMTKNYDSPGWAEAEMYDTEGDSDDSWKYYYSEKEFLDEYGWILFV